MLRHDFWHYRDEMEALALNVQMALFKDQALLQEELTVLVKDQMVLLKE
jgi:hypothetical protein